MFLGYGKNDVPICILGAESDIEGALKAHTLLPFPAHCLFPFAVCLHGNTNSRVTSSCLPLCATRRQGLLCVSKSC